MRHLNKGRKLGRTSAHRKAMFRNMVTSLLEHERISTTLPKAKELRGVAARVIGYGKRGRLLRLEADAYEASAEYKSLLASDAPRAKAELRNKRGKVASMYRLAARYVLNAEVLDQVFHTFASRYEGRLGGYTRIVRIGKRKGDAAEMAIIELMPGEGEDAPRRRVTGATTEAGDVTSKEKLAQ